MTTVYREYRLMQDDQTPGNTRQQGIQPEVIPASRRFAALCLYCGMAPAAWFLRGKHTPVYDQTHRRQAVALWGVLGILFAIFFLLVVSYSFLMIRDRSWATRSTEVWILSIGRKSLLVWAVFWLFAVWRSLRGSSCPIPYLAWFSRRLYFRYLGGGVMGVSFLSALLLVPFSLYADHQTVDETSRGKVFLLYDDQGRFPRPLFSLAMYRMIHASNRRWGAGSAVLLPLTRDNISLALDMGTLVFIGSHGTAKGLLLRDGYYRPEDVSPRKAGNGPRYVYLAGCDSGAQRDAWEQAFRPADVKSYDRMTPTLEHLFWLWSAGPRLVRDLPD